MIRGESGVGKDVFSKIIHKLSARIASMPPPSSGGNAVTSVSAPLGFQQFGAVGFEVGQIHQAIVGPHVVT
ncbi:MAG: sigma 54-interacting transcriptional regulator [Bacteroidota bacterium]